MVVATKNDGNPLFCMEFRPLKKMMNAYKRPIPYIEELTGEIQWSSIFITLDLFKGYLNVRLDESIQEMTMFRRKHGAFCFVVMPFRLKNGMACFQRVAAMLFVEFPFAIFYINEIVTNLRT